MTPTTGDHAELAQQLSTFSERVNRVSATLAEAGRDLIERRALPPDTLVGEMAEIQTNFAELRDRVVAAAATLAGGPPPPITTLRELEVLVSVLVEEGARRARTPTPAAVDTPPVVEGGFRVEAERRRPGVEDLRRRTQDEARRRAAEAEEAWRRAETEAKRRASEEAQRRATEEARRRAEDDARRKAAEAEEAQRKAEDESRRKAVAAEEERRKAAEAEAKRRAEEEAQRRAAEEARRKAEEEAQRKAAEQARQKAEEEARQRAAEEDAQRQAAAAEAKRKAEEAEQARQKAAEEARRKAEEIARKKTEDEARRKGVDAESARRRAAAADLEAKRKADQEAQQEAQRQAAEDARRQAAEAAEAARRDEQQAAVAADSVETETEPVAAADDDGVDAGLETAQWWISASASWGSMRSKNATFATAVNDVLTKYPYFLSVPIQTSADYEDGMLAYGYGLLLEHVEQRVPGFVSDALARLPARSGATLGRRLYDYLAQALAAGYGDFIKAVMLAAVPRTPPWATGGIEDGDTTTTVFVRPSARIGDTHQKAERFTQPQQRFGEHRFTAAVAPLTTRFFRIESLDAREARHLGLRISEKGVPSDQAWIVSIAGRAAAPQAKRHIPQGTVLNGIGREITSVWVGLFNSDAENEKRYDVTLEVTRRQPGAGSFRKR